MGKELPRILVQCRVTGTRGVLLARTRCTEISLCAYAPDVAPAAYKLHPSSRTMATSRLRLSSGFAFALLAHPSPQPSEITV
jgi:hypothetical protein